MLWNGLDSVGYDTLSAILHERARLWETWGERRIWDDVMWFSHLLLYTIGRADRAIAARRMLGTN